ncbi:MAG: hypothetical protein H7177_10965 [Rhizobacter sp.]|nr:hypothetical protein [Bacteriovorax sp.]
MKILGLLIFVSIFEVFGQTTKSKPDASSIPKVYRVDSVRSGMSATEKRTHPAGSLQASKPSSINGTTCLDGTGKEFTPTSKGYRKCVDQANRVKN